jgi:hypothetical protein
MGKNNSTAGIFDQVGFEVLATVVISYIFWDVKPSNCRKSRDVSEEHVSPSSGLLPASSSL